MENERIDESINETLEEGNIDCSVVFKGNYFDEYFRKELKERPVNDESKEILFRIAIGHHFGYKREYARNKRVRTKRFIKVYFSLIAN